MENFYDRYWKNAEKLETHDFSLKWPKLAGLIPKEPNITILDFGCGNGSVIKKLKEVNPGAKYFGVDVSEKAVGFAKKAVPDASLFIVRDGGRLPIDDESIDFIFSSEVIEHVYDTMATFSELSRVLRPGGKILLTTPHHGIFKNLALVLTSFDKHFDPFNSHVRFFSKRTLRAGLLRHGIEPERWGHYGRFFPFSKSIYVLAKKSYSQ